MLLIGVFPQIKYEKQSFRQNRVSSTQSWMPTAIHCEYLKCLDDPCDVSLINNRQTSVRVLASSGWAHFKLISITAFCCCFIFFDSYENLDLFPTYTVRREGA